MSLDFKPGAFNDFFRDETFRDDFTYRNSPEGIRRFPFPFDRDDYMYSVNMEPHVPGRKGSVFEHEFDVDEHYVAEMIDRAKVLADDPLRCQSLPHMTLAGWDLLELIMEVEGPRLPAVVFAWKRTATAGAGSTARLASTTASPSLTTRRCPMARSNTSPARPRAISPCRTNATARCGWMRESPPPGRLVGRFRRRHELSRMARAGAAWRMKRASSTGR